MGRTKRFLRSFLFQIGAIKTYLPTNSDVNSPLFLFQIGAIKTYNTPSLKSSMIRFYSRLVRLKPDLLLDHWILAIMFLFQIGAIKTSEAGGD